MIPPDSEADGAHCFAVMHYSICNIQTEPMTAHCIAVLPGDFPVAVTNGDQKARFDRSPMLPLLATIVGFLSIPTVFAFNWSYPVAPRQCSTFTITLTGGGIVFPLTALIVPVGPSPLIHEVRKVMEVPFPTNATTVSFQLPYPMGSKFVGLVTDASGYRGTVNTWTVLSSDDGSCFEDVQNAVSPFTFSLSPTDVAECRDVRIYWDPASVKGIPSFLSVVPDGAFRTIPPGKIDTQPGLGTGFTWTPAVRARTNLIIIGGDNRRMGSGGFISTFVNPGDPSRDTFGDCPAPTAMTGITSDSRVSAGAIVGSVLGGVVLLSLLLFFIFYLLRRKRAKPQVRKPGMEKASDFAYYGGNAYGNAYGVPKSDWAVVQDTGLLPAYTKDSGSTTFVGSRQQRLSWKGSILQ